MASVISAEEAIKVMDDLMEYMNELEDKLPEFHSKEEAEKAQGEFALLIVERMRELLSKFE